MTKCELCGSNVKVVGDTTKHYERVPIDWKKLWVDYFKLEKKPYRHDQGLIQQLVEAQLRSEE